MNLPELCIRRPVMTTLVMLGILTFGIVGYRLLPVSNLPNVDFPTISVSASVPGASPETMASTVATPMEKAFSTIAGVSSMTSSSSLGSTNVTLQFDLTRNIDAAAQDVQSAISDVQHDLPKEMPTPPSYSKVNPADQPVLFIALTSPTLRLSTLDEYGETFLAQSISMVTGVAEVQVFGAQKYAVRIQVDPATLAAKGISFDQITAAIQQENVNLPTGNLYGPDQTLTIEASGQMEQADAFRPLIVAYRNGKPVRLEELGDVLDSVENTRVAAWYGNERSIFIVVQKQPGTNTVDVADGVKALLPGFRAKLPASVSLNILYDRSDSIRASVNDVKFTLFLTLCLVVLVIFLFLRNISATIIPSLALPMSIVGTFAVMYLLGYSLDNLSLMALTLSLGFVVDDAIVMLENIVRHMERGEGVMEASLRGSREIGFTIISMTISLAAVFIPVLFMGGIIGRLFHEFAVTIGAAILISGLVSLTLTPMLCSRLLKHAGNGGSSNPARAGAIHTATERGFRAMLRAYERGLHWSLRHRRTVLVFSLVVLAATAVLFRIVPKGFLPSEDTGQISINTEAPEGSSFDVMARHQKVLADMVALDPNVDSYMSRVGGGRGSGNTGGITVRLKPRKARNLSADQLIASLRPRLAQVPGIRAFLQNPPPINVGGRQSRSQYQVTLQGSNTDELYAAAPMLLEKLRALPGLTDLTSDLMIRNPTVDVEIDRDQAAALGVSTQQIQRTLYSAYGSRQISTIYTPTNSYMVILELKPEYQADPSSLGELYISSETGQLVPLSAVATVKRSLGPLAVNHSGQIPSVTISFNLKPGVSLGQAVDDVNKVARANLPATITTSFQGTAQAFQSSMKGLGMLLLVAVLVIYLVLGILYESFIQPLTILSALPFAGFGALLTLIIFRVDLSIYAFVGVIMLVGLVKKNGIMMVDFALDAQRNESSSASDAIFEACMVRFRPIMMTTMAALMGTLPIAIGFGAGSESRRPLGLAVVGGLLFSQFFTLFVTPVFYVYMDRLQSWLARGGSRRRQPSEGGSLATTANGRS
jgi:hydrophobic/amphiphilic exporter-1 (mainly G- bacteria), HAE1 family